MRQFKKGDKVLTSLGIAGHITQIIFSKESHKPYMYKVALEENNLNMVEVHQSYKQLFDANKV